MGYVRLTVSANFVWVLFQKETMAVLIKATSSWNDYNWSAYCNGGRACVPNRASKKTIDKRWSVLFVRLHSITPWTRPLLYCVRRMTSLHYAGRRRRDHCTPDVARERCKTTVPRPSSRLSSPPRTGSRKNELPWSSTFPLYKDCLYTRCLYKRCHGGIHPQISTSGHSVVHRCLDAFAFGKAQAVNKALVATPNVIIEHRVDCVRKHQMN